MLKLAPPPFFKYGIYLSYQILGGGGVLTEIVSDIFL